MKKLVIAISIAAAINCKLNKAETTKTQFNDGAEQIKQFDDTKALIVAKRHLPYNPVILDAGAFTGKEIILMKKFWPHSTIHALEPVPEIFEKLKINTKSLPRVFKYNIGLSTTSGEKVFYLSNEPNNAEISMSSSLREPKEHLDYSATQFNKKMTLQCKNLDEWAEENNVENIDMLWLDMQGVELEIMKSAPIVMSKVKVIYTEVEFVEAYKDQAQWEEIKSWMESQGFYLAARDFDIPPNFWFGNAIFVRTR